MTTRKNLSVYSLYTDIYTYGKPTRFNAEFGSQQNDHEKRVLIGLKRAYKRTYRKRDLKGQFVGDHQNYENFVISSS